MAWTFDNALDDDDVGIISRDDHMGEWVITVGELTTPVIITIRRQLNAETVEYDTSHAIKTPLQASPYWTSRNWENDAPYALHRAVSGLTSYYRAAVDEGHAPKESWLVPHGG